MTPELKALWLGALRSGEYQQTTDTLKTANGGYCCLGVLCHVASKAGMLPPNITVVEDPDRLTFVTKDEGDWQKYRTHLPVGAFGLTEDVLNGCVDRNDGRRQDQLSFAAIADYLEIAEDAS